MGSPLNDKAWRHEYMAVRLRMQIAYQIRLIRLQRGLTQTQLARLCGTAQTNISRLENCEEQFPNLQKIAQALDCGLIVRFTDWKEVIASMVANFDDDRHFAEKDKGG